MKHSDKEILAAVLEDEKLSASLMHLIQDHIEYPGQSHKGELSVFLRDLHDVVERERNKEVEYPDDDAYCSYGHDV